MLKMLTGLVFLIISSQNGTAEVVKPEARGPSMKSQTSNNESRSLAYKVSQIIVDRNQNKIGTIRQGEFIYAVVIIEMELSSSGTLLKSKVDRYPADSDRRHFGQKALDIVRKIGQFDVTINSQRESFTITFLFTDEKANFRMVELEAKR